MQSKILLLSTPLQPHCQALDVVLAGNLDPNPSLYDLRVRVTRTPSITAIWLHQHSIRA